MSGPVSVEARLGAAIEAMLELLAGRHGRPAGDARPLALGWATVELGRAAHELARLVPGGGSFDAAPAEVLLGATCLVGAPLALGGGIANPVRLVLLEPSTEGRLAASLARHGEGPTALWVVSEGLAEHPLSRPADGPFGPERLLLGGPVDGPHLLVALGRPGTINT